MVTDLLGRSGTVADARGWLPCVVVGVSCDLHGNWRLLVRLDDDGGLLAAAPNNLKVGPPPKPEGTT